MGERYYITGVQLGILKATIEHNLGGSIKLINILLDIESNQFIGRIEENEKSRKMIKIVEAIRK